MLFNFIGIFKQVLSMSRLGGAGAVAQLVADVPLSAVEVINTAKMFCYATFFILFLLFSSTFTLCSSSTAHAFFFYQGTYLTHNFNMISNLY